MAKMAFFSSQKSNLLILINQVEEQSSPLSLDTSIIPSNPTKK
jgi:hypothetical protein